MNLTQENTHVKYNENDFIKNAQTLIQSGELRLARKVLVQGIQSGLPPSELLFTIAETYLTENNTEKAERVLRDAIAYMPTVKAYFSLARILISQDKDQRALQVLKRCLDLKDIHIHEKVEIYKTLGNVYFKTELYQESLNAYYKSLELQEDESIHISLGSCYLRMRDLEGAKSHYLSASKLVPTSGKAYFGLASCALGIGNKEAALTFFIKSLERDIHNPIAIFYLVKCAFDVKNYEKAENLLRQYLDVSPLNSSLLYSLAGLQYHLGKKIDALSTVEKILKLNENHKGAQNLKMIISG